jgi:ribonuclease Z
MAPRFSPELVNDPFGDPALWIELVFDRRALLFDLGDLGPLPPRKLLRISDVFVSHMHMDHFSGFDHLLRISLGREKTLNLYGPPGVIAAVEHKLQAYTWNLVTGYDGNLTIEVAELAESGLLSKAAFQCRTRFAREARQPAQSQEGFLLQEPDLIVRAATLDHGIPSLAFALEETAHVNVLRNRLEDLGLAVGPWLRGLKSAILRGEPDPTSIAVAWGDTAAPKPDVLPLGALREVATITPGRKIAYVVDAVHSAENATRIIDLAHGADVLFIETAFLESDAGRAAERKHLTARQAGTLARQARVKRIVTLHYSPRYEGRHQALVDEAEAAFRGGW